MEPGAFDAVRREGHDVCGSKIIERLPECRRQIHGRSRGMDAVPERARLDNYYIENWSVWRDLVIIVRTVGVLLRGDGG